MLNHLPAIEGRTGLSQPIAEINIEDDNHQEIDRCLIVDDEPFNIDALKITLQCATAERENFNFKNRVDSASNGLKAVEMVKKKYKEGFNYKLILMDCNMPKMDGYQATQRIRDFITELGVEQPLIVAISGHVEEQYIKRALDAGMNTVIAKPAKLDDIKNAISNLTI